MRVRCVVNAYGEFVVLFWGFGERVRAWRARQVCTVAGIVLDVTAQGVGMPAWGVAHSQGTQDFDTKARKKRRKES